MRTQLIRLRGRHAGLCMQLKPRSEYGRVRKIFLHEAGIVLLAIIRGLAVSIPAMVWKLTPQFPLLMSFIGH